MFSDPKVAAVFERYEARAAADRVRMADLIEPEFDRPQRAALSGGGARQA